MDLFASHIYATAQALDLLSMADGLSALNNIANRYLAWRSNNLAHLNSLLDRVANGDAQAALELGLNFIGATSLAEDAMVTVMHFTDAETAMEIESSTGLRSLSFVTLPGEVSGMSASEVQTALELEPGRSAMSATFDVPSSYLVTPYNGAVTSGGAMQFQTTQTIPIPSGTFVPHP